MPQIWCHYKDCKFLDGGYCSAVSIKVDPNDGCLTFVKRGDHAIDSTLEDEDPFNEGWQDLGYDTKDNILPDPEGD